jgi:two-component system cell cycle sensor histidine kinase/response regulator CckA
MTAFRDRPIGYKVTILILIASAVSLVLAATGLLLYDVTTVRSRAVRDLTAQAHLLRITTVAAVEFADADAASENLSALAARRDIAAATIHTVDGRLFAHYLRDRSEAPPPARDPLAPGAYFAGRTLTLIQPIEVEGAPLGWLSLHAELPPLLERVRQYGVVAGAVLIALLTLASVLARLLRRSVSAPLLRLAATARTISVDKDYRVRAEPAGHDEIGRVTEAFNGMLDAIESGESALRESSAQLEEAMRAARMAQWRWDVRHDVFSWGGEENRLFPAGTRPAGRSLAAFLAIVHPDDRPTAERALRHAADTGTRCEFSARIVASDGGIRWLALRGQAASSEAEGIPVLAGLALDITERRHLEEQLVESQKVEAIGRLAGGIAHDFNNLLTAILGYARFALETLPDESPTRDDILEIQRAGERAAALTAQLLAYARRQLITPRIVDVNALATGMSSMLHRLLGATITLELRRGEGLWPTRIDPNQLEQVLLNLVLNARDAMPDGGVINVATSNLTLSAAQAGGQSQIEPGSYLLVTVSDTGVGMDARTQAQIFEPFFTTKEQGKGTGLGLAVCFGIVRQAGGHIWVYSEPGQGSTFKVLLPRAAATAGAPEPAAPEDVLARGEETVMVVEDEAAVRTLAARSLVEAGYTVLEASNGEEAVTTAAAYPAEIHLLVADVVMPGMSGREVAEALVSVRPGLRVVYMSGYAEDAVLRRGIVEDGIPFLAKPFDPLRLARIVRTALDGSLAGGPR